MDLEDDNRPLRKRRSKGDEPSDVEADVTGVEVKLSFFALAFFFFACTPRVEIDGKVRKKNWGTHFFPLSPGKHTIKVYFRYLFMSECGANSINVNVTHGNITRISYFMWPWMFAKGSLQIVNEGRDDDLARTNRRSRIADSDDERSRRKRPSNGEPMYLDDEGDRPRRDKAKSHFAPILLATIFGGGFLLILACCGGLFFLGKSLPKTANPKEYTEPIKWGDSAEFSPISVRISSAKYGREEGSSPAGHLITANQTSLLVTLEIKNSDGTKNQVVEGAFKNSSLTDTFGNSLSKHGVLRTEFGFECVKHGQIKNAAEVRSDQSISDSVAFDQPVPDATTLLFRVPATCYGGHGSLIFEIPESEWKPPETLRGSCPACSRPVSRRADMASPFKCPACGSDIVLREKKIVLLNPKH